eukprot:11496999-Alexandrium_andersonii.AAC.1
MDPAPWLMKRAAGLASADACVPTGHPCPNSRATHNPTTRRGRSPSKPSGPHSWKRRTSET